MQLLFLELNEVNLESIHYYCKKGLLPNFAALIAEHGWAETTSELRHDELEPWIQWVTAHTGQCLAEHGVFRLGDITKKDIPQIWERLEDYGLRVGALSPMNAKHRAIHPAFFVPDPWTKTGLTATPRLTNLYHAIEQAVNDNAQSKLTLQSARQLLLGFLAYSRPEHYFYYLRLASLAKSQPWNKAIFLDVLLADVFAKEVARTNVHFATLFLNAAAHIQHHYMFSAACYEGPHRNPDWYVPRFSDPLRDVYAAYDRILASIRRLFPEARIMVATGLHQVPHGEITYYWRLRRHADFMKKISVPFISIQPRMSRDFLLECASASQASFAEHRLSAAITENGMRLFEVDNRGSDLFVTLSFQQEIRPRLEFRIGDEHYILSSEDVAFVALKNGEHNGTGYFVDSGASFDRGGHHFPLRELPDRIMCALGIEPSHLDN
jgi:hypothetical protein